ncbi:sialic acid O-acyltransferase [Hafnia paralvei ATCC 29927]|jgi:sugar O-acyltransferase (sialic acid O-acetyltransferase NeuD family)|uniref:Putative acetyltransferase EpsM n=1 Tax=Hafnia alvei TaxID=569 RepID=A0A172X028_HAFAL|nr:NeuD/PglB/VioB family sugar acetyltransferase [Hafnia paralvei]ANF29971.1 putative acetyltransferase EpsM [Hafnia alvei]MDU1193830.1 NeuD/PglB/VioB family sugar acetyltransferase [Enterobacteriaceae bacterium]ANF30195.1 putative acetyltransferase EpsM [Hafnia alvei]MDU1245918.1 NeuD/PglB/VioB family sugar acetyltransferase [Enterobacteriaceae bacterium]MDX6843129.1 NeuD/PglB/VioB family sugar acetyltransferase [Hafnia paralvei]
MKKKLIIIGAGGFAKSVIDSLDYGLYELVGFIDSYKTGMHQGLSILANSIESIECADKYSYFIAIGDPDIRAMWFELLDSYHLDMINVFDATAIISKRAKLGICIYIGKMAIVNCDSIIENGVVINTRALVEHGNRIGFCTNISTNVVLNGDVRVGDKSFIGSCTVVNGQLEIGSGAIIGSGSVVIRNISNNIVVAGSPTKLIKVR